VKCGSRAAPEVGRSYRFADGRPVLNFSLSNALICDCDRLIINSASPQAFSAMNGLPPTPGPHLSGWAQAKNEADGKFYYYNSITKQTTWEKPEELKDDVEVRSACHSHLRTSLTIDHSALSRVLDGRSRRIQMAGATTTTKILARLPGAYPTTSRKSSIRPSKINLLSVRRPQAPPHGLLGPSRTLPRSTTDAPIAMTTKSTDAIATVTEETASANSGATEAIDRTSPSPLATSYNSPHPKMPKLPS
jgi:hypothetical protein